LLPLVAGLVSPGRAVVIGPTYGEFTRATRIAGHEVTVVHELGQCDTAKLVMLANPNNPDGRLFERAELLALAAALRRRGGILVVDEAFMDTQPAGTSVAADVGCGNLVVLRSFGKFFGLAGLRLGFALAGPATARRLRAALGPWAVSGPAIAVGAKALADADWIEQTRNRLAKAAARLDGILAKAGWEIAGGTSLFRLTRVAAARAWFFRLGRAGIIVRTFSDQPRWVRFGLPGAEADWQRLQAALQKRSPPQAKTLKA
jgi:cobalamin biosynthetic protein CobC